MNASSEVVRGVLRALRFGEPRAAGALTLIPVSHDGPAHAYALFLEAQTSGKVTIGEVGEVGSVPTLLVRNDLDAAVLLCEGEVLAGLKQNRVLNTTVLVPRRSKTEIPVACVEQGRWHRASATMARDAYNLAPSARALKQASVAQAVRTGGRYEADQAGVWRAVEAGMRAHGVGSDTMSWSDVGRARAPEIEREIARVEPEPGQTGVLAIVGDVLVLDLFDKPETLRAMWRGLVGSYVAEALVATRSSLGVHDARRWLLSLADREATEHPGVGLGTTVQITGVRATASALVIEDGVVHLSALGRDGERRDRAEARFATPRARTRWFRTDAGSPLRADEPGQRDASAPVRSCTDE